MPKSNVTYLRKQMAIQTTLNLCSQGENQKYGGQRHQEKSKNPQEANQSKRHKQKSAKFPTVGHCQGLINIKEHQGHDQNRFLISSILRKAMDHSLGGNQAYFQRQLPARRSPKDQER